MVKLMNGRDEQVKREAEDLWIALHDEPPIMDADGALLLRILVQTSKMPCYEIDWMTSAGRAPKSA